MWGVAQNFKLLEGGICETSEGKDSAHTNFENSWGENTNSKVGFERNVVTLILDPKRGMPNKC